MRWRFSPWPAFWAAFSVYISRCAAISSRSKSPTSFARLRQSGACQETIASRLCSVETVELPSAPRAVWRETTKRPGFDRQADKAGPDRPNFRGGAYGRALPMAPGRAGLSDGNQVFPDTHAAIGPHHRRRPINRFRCGIAQHRSSFVHLPTKMGRSLVRANKGEKPLSTATKDVAKLGRMARSGRRDAHWRETHDNSGERKLRLFPGRRWFARKCPAP